MTSPVFPLLPCRKDFLFVIPLGSRRGGVIYMQENVHILSVPAPFASPSSRNRAPLSNATSYKVGDVLYLSHVATKHLKCG